MGANFCHSNNNYIILCYRDKEALTCVLVLFTLSLHIMNSVSQQWETDTYPVAL
jgi:hypothetical protein